MNHKLLIIAAVSLFGSIGCVPIYTKTFSHSDEDDYIFIPLTDMKGIDDTEVKKLGNYATNRQIWEQAAKQNDTDAQVNLGILYYFGYGVDKDYRAARYWWEKAARQNNVTAQKYLGFLYLSRGGNIKRDDQKAAYWLEKAAAQGDEDAVKSLDLLKIFNNG